MIPRVVLLGSEVTAQVFFTTDNGLLIDDTNVPTYSVFDGQGDFVLEGTGIFDDKTKGYKATFTIPTLAEVSTKDSPYSIVWVLKSNKKIFNNRETFEVQTPAADLPSNQEQQKLTTGYEDVDLSIPLPYTAEPVEIKIFDSNENVVKSILSGEISQYNYYNGFNSYTYTVPQGFFTPGMDYLVMWVIKENNMKFSYFQLVRCCSLWEIGRIKDLRMYLDKVSKAIDLYTGYKDSDLFFYLIKGAEYLDSVGIPTQWGLVYWQVQMKNNSYWLLEAAKWVGLRAQFLAEADSTFDFSSQPVTLTVDRTGFIESELGRIKDDLDNKFKEYKENLVKNSMSVGYLNISVPTVTKFWATWDLRSKGIPLTRFYPVYRI